MSFKRKALGGHRTISRGGLAYSVTVTFGYGRGDLRVVVAANILAALAEAQARWGKWQTVESISTPDTIYADLTGLTKARMQPGSNRGGGAVGAAETTRQKLVRAGYTPAPGECGSIRYHRDELPRAGKGVSGGQRVGPKRRQR